MPPTPPKSSSFLKFLVKIETEFTCVYFQLPTKQLPRDDVAEKPVIPRSVNSPQRRHATEQQHSFSELHSLRFASNPLGSAAEIAAPRTPTPPSTETPLPLQDERKAAARFGLPAKQPSESQENDERGAARRRERQGNTRFK
ncbi:unnamed protein product [Gongylonema pulchrum]|uniref:Uncharacterized protein n=1 Tax=Gongylonema pulchrum TaxID=637853 RepID=A0A183DLD6_9BILA|nr:unnamed protein product [Gongylonema pulchrum]